MVLFIGIIGIGISIYAIFFHHPAPDLTYRVLTNTNVVDMKENVSKLKIMYDKDLIDNESNSLKMLTFTVQNLGNENIEIK